MLELTIISAQGLKRSTSFSLFSNHLKPFITITTFSLPSPNSIKGCKRCHVYSTRVDDGGANPTWGDKFVLPFDATSFTNCIYLHLFTKRALLGPLPLGWIQIPVSDIILDGHFPLGLALHLSYQVREKCGSRGHGVVNVACRFVGDAQVILRQPRNSNDKPMTGADTWMTATGIPVAEWPGDGRRWYCHFRNFKASTSFLRHSMRNKVLESSKDL